MRADELLQAHLRLMLTDFSAWKELYAENAVMEFVYGSSAGVDTPLRGIDAITASVGGFLNNVRGFRTEISRILRVEGDDAVIAEFTGAGVAISTNRPYDQTYLVYLRARSGKIVLLREYFDPSRVVSAFAPSPPTEAPVA